MTVLSFEELSIPLHLPVYKAKRQNERAIRRINHLIAALGLIALIWLFSLDDLSIFTAPPCGRLHEMVDDRSGRNVHDVERNG